MRVMHAFKGVAADQQLPEMPYPLDNGILTAWLDEDDEDDISAALGRRVGSLGGRTQGFSLDS